MARRPAFIRWGVEKEARIQSRLLDVLEARFRRQLAAAVAAEMRRINEGYRLLGSVPPPNDAHEREIREIYLALAEASARTFGRRMVTQAKAAGIAIETKQEDQGGFFSRLFRSLANTWVGLEAIRRRITSVSDTTRAQIVSQVDRGQRDGLGVAEIAKLIEDRTPTIARARGALIARTETHGAANYAMHETAKSTGLELEKEWVSVEDARTRSIPRDDAFDHVAMNGQVRDMDQPFDMPWVGGAGDPLKIMYPGEAGKPGGATINCRCASVHRVKGLD